MTAVTASEARPVARRRYRPTRWTVLVAGVVVVPLALMLVFNSWGPLTEESAVRMAFAQVAGQTVAILSALAFVVLTIRRGVDWAATAGALLVAALVISWSAAAIDRAAGDLVDRIATVQSVSLLEG
ncbi:MULTISPECIES: hypothetical protein [unclassified Microbacterium]|uniref:hypothetical protein n=1 Tax=unclassified Microbacterium TaxID=2609290 RepID=UPI0003695B55|nr:hypothetical protein [Microbacterium sp. 11MF]